MILRLLNAEDIQDAFKRYYFAGILQEMLEAEMTQHLGYDAYKHMNISHSNGRKKKLFLVNMVILKSKITKTKKELLNH